MERAYKFLIAGLAIGLLVAAAGTIAYTSSSSQQLDCKQCHQGHGSVVAPNVNVNGTIYLTGDTPQDENIPISDIFDLNQTDILTLKARNGVGVPSHGVPVMEFLKAYGVNDFDRIVLYADDFEMSANKSDMTNETIFVPNEYSIRIVGSDMPVSSWAKNIRTIVIIGGNAGNSITMNGKELSYGQMLDDGIDTLVYSRRSVGYTDQDTNNDYEFESGYLVYGIKLNDLLFKEGYTDFSNVTIKSGTIVEKYDRSDVLLGSLFVTRDQGRIKIATADQGRENWTDVDSIQVS
jgi:hypothetical protein